MKTQNAEMIPRFLKAPAQSFFLFGPRGTGKTTWIRSEFPKAPVLDLLEPDVFQDYHLHPERLREFVEAHPEVSTFIIDEVQRVPALLDEVHALIEKRKSHLFILTGSSARKLKQSGANLLAGRALLTTLHPFMAGEMKERFSLDRALTQGLLPLVEMSQDPRRALKTYVALYLREEIQQEGITRRLTVFSRFLEEMSFSHGQTLNLSNVARDCGVDRKTVDAYVRVLEDLLLAFQLPVFTHRAKRGLSAHPKFYFFDAGVFRVLRPSGPADRPEEIAGPALEGLVAQHLRAWNAYAGGENTLHFWRTRSGVEVDFVVYGPDTFVAIEVKNTGRLRSEELSGLKAFREDYPQAKLILLHRGSDRLLRDGILCQPVEEFLRGLHPSKSLGPNG